MIRSLSNFPDEIKIAVDLNAEENKKSSDRSRATVFIKQTKELSFDVLRGFLSGQLIWDREGKKAVQFLESMSFLDHLLREWPTQRYTAIKKSFFMRGSHRAVLSPGIEALKGAFASMRIVNNFPTGATLSVNVDVANGTFLSKMDLFDLVKIFAMARDDAELVSMFNAATKDGSHKWKHSTLYQRIKVLQKIKVVAKHRAGEYTIKRFVPVDSASHSFEKDGQSITVFQYFRQQYGRNVLTRIPLVETSRNEFLPIDVLTVPENQRYPFKLNPSQTSNMIKFAVTLPKERWEAVQHGLKMFDWEKDPYLANFGLKINPQPARVKARILPTPEIAFGQGKVSAGDAVRGRWQLTGMRFLTPNQKPLQSWGFCVLQGRARPAVDQVAAQKFVNEFIRIYKGHGGVIERTDPAIFVEKVTQGGEMITNAWNKTGNKFKAEPQLIFFVFPSDMKDAVGYNSVKKACECRYGIPSQCLQGAHVMTCKAQYISNVCMKVNAKLGGSTCRTNSNVLPRVSVKDYQKIPTMIVAADVSHAPPGSEGGSMAAITCSMDQNYTRYAAQCETNGHRVEIITTENINKLLGKMIYKWIGQFGGQLPKRILFIRDGVSEGRYEHVLDQEVKDMKALCRRLNPHPQAPVPDFTVVIAGKRHHVRFFQAPGSQTDKNGNPIPGTLVETGCTHPFEFDFYLNSHVAIKGTARPVHYHVLLNDNNAFKPEELQQIIFEHSFQYCRATTPVSLHPAVYYAHLASKRSGCHEERPLSSGEKDRNKSEAGITQQKLKSEAGTAQPKDKYTKISSDNKEIIIPPLAPMNPNRGIDWVMWYV